MFTVTHVVGVFVETELDELDEMFAEVAGQLRRRVLGYEKQRPHRVQVGVGRLALGQLDRRYAQTPDVNLRRQNCTVMCDSSYAVRRRPVTLLPPSG